MRSKEEVSALLDRLNAANMEREFDGDIAACVDTMIGTLAWVLKEDTTALVNPEGFVLSCESGEIDKE